MVIKCILLQCSIAAIFSCVHGVDQNVTKEEDATSVGVCAEKEIVCPRNLTCVDDDNMQRGYRCCKTKICGKEEGISCEDPGEIDHATRVPQNRGRRKFYPRERIMFTCESLYKFDKGNGSWICTSTGAWSKPKPKCVAVYIEKPPIIIHQPETTEEAKTEAYNSSTVVIVVGVFSVSLLIGAIAGFIFWRKYRSGDGNYILTRRHSSMVLENNFSLPPLNPAALSVGAIPAERFLQYVAIRHNNNDQRFIEEFEEIQNWSSSRLTWEASLLSENKEKNRYTNIVAYDHSRVRLHLTRSRQNLHRGSDYVNANYISSYNKPKTYIACQGPLPSTFSDFWKMVWENNTATIVMITNLVEKGRRKCDQYWPQEGKEQYKHITVTLKNTETFANYTVRSFTLKNNKLTRRNATRGGERRVQQFHFTQWPDHGAPEYLLPVLTFIRKSYSANPSHAGPIVIHCSAGVGRTGTYIVIHSMMQMLQATGCINIMEFLRHIRMQRNHLVQTEDQYVFVHDALLEYIVSDVTECSLLQLARYYKNLIAPSKSATAAEQTHDQTEEVGQSILRSGLEKQFMKVVYARGDSLDYDFALRSVNERKNRPGAVLPVFRSRVFLCNRTSAEGSDYINASFVQGYRSSHEFVITQLPLSNTKKDFWQLIWDQNCPTIVTIMDGEWNPDNDPYWPMPDKPFHFSSFNVSFGSETSLSSSDGCDIVTRDFILEATKDDYVLEVKQFQLSHWNKEEPSQAQLNAVSSVVKHAKSKDGNTVIQDRYGSTAAMQLACWHTMQCQLDNENTVDVYQTAVVACQMRPRVFTSPQHLKFLYEAVLLEAKARCNPQQTSNEAARSEVENGLRTVNPGSANSSSTGDNLTDASETDRLVA